VDEAFAKYKPNSIYIQAKDLLIYQIDYEKHELISIIDANSQPLRKSIFFNIERLAQNRDYFEGLKEYIQTQEREGNDVRLPKINEEIVAVKEQGKLVIGLYNIKRKQVVRRIKLTTKQTKFDADEVEKIKRTLKKAKTRALEDVMSSVANKLKFNF